MKNDWQVKINDHISMLRWEILIYRELPEGKVEILQPGNIVKIQDRTEPVEPSFVVESRQTLQALANALNEMGVNPHKEYTEGKLEATESHLSDLRQMLKLK